MRILQSILMGCGLAFAAAVQPGPLQAFLVSRVLASGWRRTLPACLSPLLSDGPIAVVALLVLGQLPTFAQQALRASGGSLLLYLAWKAFGRWRGAATASPGSAPRTLIQAALVNVLNPNPYLGWALVIGPSIVEAWRVQPASAVALVVAFYVTMVVTLAGFVWLVGAARLVGAKVRRSLAFISALVLAVLGAFLLVVGVCGLWLGSS